jgi:hypothetical protein
MEKYRPNILEPPKQKPTRLNEIQAYQRVFEKMLYGEEMPDVGKRFLRLLAEVHELKEFESIPNLKEELETNAPLRQAIAGEIVDVLILGINVLGHLGFDAENEILKKININFSKYNAKRLEYWLSQGLSREEAIKKLKEEWNEAFSKDEYGNTIFK